MLAQPEPGETWRSRGRAGHTPYHVRVVKRTRGGKVVFDTADAPSKRMRSRLHTLSLERFLADYERSTE